MSRSPTGRRRLARPRPSRRPRRPGATTGGGDVADLLEATAGLIAAGLPAVVAAVTVADVLGAQAPVASALLRAHALGGAAGAVGLAAPARIAAASEGLSRRQRQALGWVADVLDLAEPLGVPVREVLLAVAEAVRADDADLDAAQAAAAGPRAGAAVLTAMPAACLGLGALVGADVLGTLVGTPVGRACLLLGAGAWAAGRWWIRRLVAAALEPRDRAGGARLASRWRRRESRPVASGGGLLPGRGHAALRRIDDGVPSRPVGPARRRRSEPPLGPLPAPLIATLLAVGVEAGIAPQLLLPAIAEGLLRLDHPLGRALLRLAREPGPSAAAPPDQAAIVADLARALALAHRAGVPPADLLRQAAATQRRRERQARQVALSRLPVLLVLPSGLLLLPAAVALGVVPVVADLLARTLHG